MAAVIPALLQVVEERIKTTPLGRLTPCRRLSGSQPHPHRLAVEVERFRDARLRPPAGLQRDDLFIAGIASGMKGSASLLSPGWWPGNLVRLRHVQFPLGFSRRSDSQLGGCSKVAVMAGEDLAQGIGQIVQEMPPVRDLNGGGRTLADAISVGASTITSDNLDARMSFQPCGNGVSLAVGQQVDRTIALKIDQNGAVTLAAAPRPVVDADDARCWDRRHRLRPDQTQQRVAADRHGEPGGQPGAGIPARTQGDGALRLGKPAGAPDPRRRNGGQAFGEDAARAIRCRAAEAADLQTQFTDPTLPGQVTQATVVTAMDATRWSAAQRTGRRGSTDMGCHHDTIGVECDLIDNEAGRQQGKQRFGQGFWCSGG